MRDYYIFTETTPIKLESNGKFVVVSIGDSKVWIKADEFYKQLEEFYKKKYKV